MRGSILFLTLRTGKCLSNRHRKVESYLEKRSSTGNSDRSASLEKSSLDSNPCWKAFLSNLLQVRTLNESKNSHRLHRQTSFNQRMIRDRWSMHKDLRRRLIGTSNENVQDPTFVVRREITCCTSPNDWRYSLNLTVGVDWIFQVDIEIPNHSNGTPKSHKFLQSFLKSWKKDSDIGCER